MKFWKKDKKIGIALGGGGVRGLAHIPLLDVFDEMEIKPYCIAGTSMGAIIGVLYCSGVDAKTIRKELQIEGNRRLNFPGLDKFQDFLKWIQFVKPGMDGKSLFRADKFINYLFERIKTFKFADLKIPLKVVATDFWSREQVIFSSGNLPEAIMASMAVPGIFAPIERDGRLLVDGGITNPVPWDVLPHECDIRVAVEVTGRRQIGQSAKKPFIFDLVFNSFETIEHNLNKIKRQKDPPDIYLEPNLVDIGMFDFHKTREVFLQTEPSRELLRNALLKLL